MAQEKIPKTLEERTVRFSKKDLVPMDRVPCLNLDDLEETAAFQFPDSDEYMLIECEPKGMGMKTCPICKQTGYLNKNGRTPHPRLCHDVTVGVTKVDLSVSVPKYICKKCNAVVNHEFPSLVPGRQFTKRLLQQIKVDSFYGIFSDIAMKHGISIPTVESIFDEYAKELEEKHVQQEVGSWLAIDEKHIVKKMRGIIVDGETGNLIEMTENNTPATMKAAIMKIPGYEHVKYVTTDMANG